MTNSSGNDVPTTSDALMQEFTANGWDKRLSDCRDQRIDETTHFDEGEREYHTRTVSRHYENGIQIAVSITYDYHAGNSRTVYRMLLVNGKRHFIP